MLAAGGLAVMALVMTLRWLRARYLLVNVIGRSMEPTLHHGDRVLARRRTVDQVRLGDVVAFRPPEGHPWPPGDGNLMIKRVVALPGGRVSEAAVPADGQWTGGALPAGLFVVRGDHAEISLDSRQLGPVPAELLVGPIVRKLTPSLLKASPLRPGNPRPRRGGVSHASTD